MSFNFKRAKLETHKPEKESVRVPRISKEEREQRKKIEKIEISLYVIYLMKNYQVSYKKNKKEFNIRVWSKLDRRYTLNIYTNDVDKTIDYIYKEYKKRDSVVIDVREATQKELIQKYRMRFL